MRAGHRQVEDLHLFRIAPKPFPKMVTKYLTSTTSLISCHKISKAQNGTNFFTLCFFVS